MNHADSSASSPTWQERPVLAVTVGETAGIGPEIAIRAAWALRHQLNAILIGDAAFLAMLAEQIDPAINLIATSLQALRLQGLPQFGPDIIAVIDCPVLEPVQAGQLNVRNARSVLQTLDIAVEGCAQGWFEAMVTAPLQKSTINDAGIKFSGHTEYLAEKCQVEQVVMMLAGPTHQVLPNGQEYMLRVALATTHLPLQQVAAALTQHSLQTTLKILHQDLKEKFGLDQPRILVTGLNPHAGEGGYLGREEMDVIHPVLAALQATGMQVRGPFPADTLFQPKYLAEADCVLAMYHDQGLPVLKFATFGRGVNITLGLPLIRTSVDHGTALDLARQGLGKADVSSMQQAMLIAAQMAVVRKNGKTGG